ncbi:MAG: phasin family protein [Burkholderiaceae bacterium]
MTKPETDFTRMQADQVRNFNTATARALEGFQKLAELNLETARASMDASNEQIRELLAARDVKTLTELVTSYSKPRPDAFKAYAQAVYAISRETGNELADIIEQQVAESQRQLYSAVEDLASKAPAGSEGAVAFTRQVMAASSTAYDQLNKAARQFAQMADSAVSGETQGARPTRRK